MKNNILKRSFLTAIMILSVLAIALGQTQSLSTNYLYPERNPYLVPPGPEVASFLKYGEYPVSYSTGIPDISLPIYTIKTRELSLPITLTYLSGGIKVTDEASWVGLGWVLNAGGAINCSIQGMPDKLKPELPSAEWIRQNDRYDILNKLVAATNGGLNGIDKMRDRYDYSFMDQKGTFYMMNADSILQAPYTTNAIRRLYSENKIVTKGFVITDANGTSYHFETPETATAYSTVHNHSNNSTHALMEPYTYDCSWYLTKIVSFNQTDSIEFVYEKDNKAYNDYVFSQGYSETRYSGDDAPLLPVKEYLSFISAKRTSNIPVLKEIRFTEGKVLFNHTNDRKDCRQYRLTQIKVQNKTGRTLKTIEFNHSYFGGNRLKLDKVTCKGQDGEIYDNYEFGYYNEGTVIPTSKPQEFAGLLPLGTATAFYSQDMLGYYNGKGNNSLLGILPTDAPSYNQMIADRTFSPQYAKAHSLQKIKYITGAETEFVYDAEQGAIAKNPALRIKEIRNTDPTKGTESVSHKIYNYYDSKYSYNIGPDYTYTDITCGFEWLSETTRLESVRLRKAITYYSEPLTPNIAQSFKIKYGKVEELITGESNVFSGVKDTIKTVYEYNNEWTKVKNTQYFLSRFTDADDAGDRRNCILSTIPRTIYVGWTDMKEAVSTRHNIYGYVIDNNWTDSYLTKVSTYKYKDGKYVIIQSKENEYQCYDRNDEVPIGLYCKGVQFSWTGSGSPGYSADYLYYHCPSVNNFYFFDICVSTGWKKLISTITKDYNGDNVTTKKDTYQYGAITRKAHPHPFLTGHLEDMGETGRNIYTYQYPSEADSLDVSVKEKMLAGNFIAPVIWKQKISFIKNSPMTETELYNYKNVNQKILLGSISKTYINGMSGTSSSKGEYKTNILAYDSKGNPLWLVNQAGFSTVYLWSYNYTYPVAEIKNATLNDVKTSLGTDLETFGQSSSYLYLLEQLRSKIPSALIKTYTYDPLVGKLTETAPNGITTYYRYDTCGRLNEIYLKEGQTEKSLHSYQYHYQNY